MMGMLTTITDLISLADGALFDLLYALTLTVASFMQNISGAAFDGLNFAIAIDNDCERCPASAFTSVGAAWGSIGYAFQSDLLWQLRETSLGHWPILLYIMAAFGGIIGAAMGMPPKTYLWFMIGPGLFWWLIGATEDVQGVQWKVAGEPQKQEVVWRDAEVGLQRSNLFNRETMEAYRDKAPQVGEDMRVANAFLYVDSTFSATADALITWTGIWNGEGRGGNDSNLARNEQEEGPWFIMTNNKWGMMENVTASYAKNPDVRDSLVQFLASECGDKFKQSIDASSYLAASQLCRGIFPRSVFKVEGGPNLSGTEGNLELPRYEEATRGLDTTAVRPPPSLLRLLEDTKTEGSFGKFSQALGSKTYKQEGRDRLMVCSEYLWVLVQALRWEAGHAYWQMMRSAPLGLNHNQIMISLYDGWNIRKEANGERADEFEMHHLTRNLIFVHLLRNELIFAPQIADTKYAPAEQSKQYGEAQASKVGSKSKNTELLQWAMLMPHVQGVLYFLLCAAYPLAAVLIVVPGWHKTFFTWVSFLAWVKLWDVGFAMVQTIERSVWAMMGNNSQIEFVSRRLMQLAEFESIGATCQNGGGIEQLDGTIEGLKKLCAVPRVCASDSTESLGCDGSLSGLDTPGNTSYGVLDQALMLGAGADLDLANSYYLYIMAALYFAVPAVTGQLVLGAKAGAAGMISTMIGGVATDVGRAAVTGHQGVLSHIASANQAGMTMQAQIKSLKNGGFAQQALDMQNAALDANREADFLTQTKNAYESGNKALGLRNSDLQTAAKRAMIWKSQWGPGNNSVQGKAGDIGATPAGYGGVSPGMMFKAASSAGVSKGLKGGFVAAVRATDPFVAMQKWTSLMEHDSIARGMNVLGQSADLDWQITASRSMGHGYQEGGRRNMAFAEGSAQMSAWNDRNRYGLAVSGIGAVLGNVQSGALSPGVMPMGLEYLGQGGYLGESMKQSSLYPGSSFAFDTGNRAGTGVRTLGSSQMWGLWDTGAQPYRTTDGNLFSVADATFYSTPLGPNDHVKWAWQNDNAVSPMFGSPGRPPPPSPKRVTPWNE